MLVKHGEDARILAGGTDLLLGMRERTLTCRAVIGLKQVPGLDRCSGDKGITLGPLVTHRAVVDNPLIRMRYSALWKACSKVGTPNIRSMGTVGGNCCNGAPSADTVPPLIAYNAAVTLKSLSGERSLPLASFFLAPGKTALMPGEVLVAITVPDLPLHTGADYVKLPARTSVDIAAVGVAACITLDAQKRCREAHIVLGAVAPTPIEAKGAEVLLIGEKLTRPVIEKAAQVATEHCCPISDVRASAVYRAEMVAVLTAQALDAALAQAAAA